MRSTTKLRRLESFEESRFWVQLARAETGPTAAAVDQLRSTVRTVVEQASEISDQINRYLPHYTLHDERHLLNVLAIMDALVPDELVERLTPLESGLCILTAFVHDLGMALPHEEVARLQGDEDTPERRRFLRHRSGYAVELQQIERWQRRGGTEAKRRIELLEGSILADYIRKTHTDEDRVGRIEAWLVAMEEAAENPSLFRYGQERYRRELALLGASHGQDAGWLRRRLDRLAGRQGGFCHLVGLGEWVNYAFPGLLLRLADIMDFDATRAPRILFQHIGIDNGTSILEWRKHMSIVGWDLRADRKHQRLRYQAECPHPVIEKAIREFVGQIETELTAVEIEFDGQRRWLEEDEQRFELFLPSRVDLAVRSQRGPDGPAYLYADLHFELDQGEIQGLLMGEALYADPSIALRELLQNALDAVTMRDLRLRLREAGVREGHPADPLPAGEELGVALSWGLDEATGQEVIRVRDNGIGMSREVVAEYFTQVGRSFYRSPEFVREQALLKSHGLRASPISRFGIGFLACFMIAERLLVRTHPGELHPDGEPRDITILGPDSLFWLRPGTLEEQGTEVTLFLKPGFRLEARVDGSPGPAVPSQPEAGQNQRIRPEEIVRSNVVWPRHPITLHSPDGISRRLDDTSWRQELARRGLSPSGWIERAADWGATERELGAPAWSVWQWRDDDGPEATGSGLRILYPTWGEDPGSGLPTDPPAESPHCRQDELAALVETDLARRLDDAERTRILIRGIAVPEADLCLAELPLAHGMGALAELDLDGAAAPELTADRRTLVAPAEADGWREALAGLFARLRDELARQLAGEPATTRNLLTALRWEEPGALTSGRQAPEAELDLLGDLGMDWWDSPHRRLLWGLARWLQELALQDAGRLPRSPQVLDDLRAEPEPGTRPVGRWRSFAAERQPARRLDPELARQVLLPLEHAAARHLAPELARDLARAVVRRGEVDGWSQLVDACRVGCWLQHALEPDLSRALPMLGTATLAGRLGDGGLVAPGRIRFELERDGRTVHRSVGHPATGPPDAQGYHLILPLTAVPMGELRRHCPAWRTDRRLATLGAAPFLYPGLDDLWARHAVTLLGLLGVPEIYALLPSVELWSKPFARWSERECTEGCLSARWSVATGVVSWMVGRHPLATARQRGRPLAMLEAEPGLS